MSPGMNLTGKLSGVELNNLWPRDQNSDPRTKETSQIFNVSPVLINEVMESTWSKIRRHTLLYWPAIRNDFPCVVSEATS